MLTILKTIGGDVEKIVHFQSGKYVHMVATFFSIFNISAVRVGGDVEKIVIYQRGK